MEGQKLAVNQHELTFRRIDYLLRIKLLNMNESADRLNFLVKRQ